MSQQLRFVKLIKRPEAPSISLVHYLADFLLQADCSFYSGHLQKIDVEEEVKRETQQDKIRSYLCLELYRLFVHARLQALLHLTYLRRKTL